MAKVHSENHAQNDVSYLRRFGIKEPRLSGVFSDEIKCYLHRSTAVITISREDREDSQVSSSAPLLAEFVFGCFFFRDAC